MSAFYQTVYHCFAVSFVLWFWFLGFRVICLFIAISFESGSVSCPHFFFNLFQDCFHYLRPLQFHMNLIEDWLFQICTDGIFKNFCWTVMEFYRNFIEPVCFLGSIAVVTMLNFIVRGHGLSFYLAL